MLDELKDITFKGIKGLNSLQKAEAYIERKPQAIIYNETFL